ncbi:hypothetical protein [uncultured Parabacteroides sp.]|jgi:hypothetical protein|uniref:hypothetical protein n=1 Tax=uncultured Parabacteroides sp. TaxID=512312 RepID=UPI0025F446A5|nr:hypothetical protein [uncultured Parabacteroides sp.]
MRRRQGAFSENQATHFHDDRLHRHDDRLRCRELPGSLPMNIDFTAMKTVVVEIFCAPHGNQPFKTAFLIRKQQSGIHLQKAVPATFDCFLQ